MFDPSRSQEIYPEHDFSFLDIYAMSSKHAVKFFKILVYFMSFKDYCAIILAAHQLFDRFWQMVPIDLALEIQQHYKNEGISE